MRKWHRCFPWGRCFSTFILSRFIETRRLGIQQQSTTCPKIIYTVDKEKRLNFVKKQITKQNSNMRADERLQGKNFSEGVLCNK